MVNSVSCRLTIEGSRLYQYDSHSMLLKECSLAQYTCVTRLCSHVLEWKTQACVWCADVQTHSSSSHRGFLTNTPLIPLLCSIIFSLAHFSKLLVDGYRANSVWNHESAFPWIDVMCFFQNRELPLWQQHQDLSGASVKWCLWFSDHTLRIFFSG